MLPERHERRCLNFGTARLVRALARAAQTVQARHPGSPPLGVGDLSRAQGGPIAPYSKSHQSGRDADLAFYATNAKGAPVPASDLVHFDAAGRAEKDRALTFDARRTWTLVEALLDDATIRVEWLFISQPLRALLLDEGKRQGASGTLLARAAQVLHQPSDAPPHADHLHLRILCTDEERRSGCRG
jgi:penicillin-insensitive murein endopeptidase